MVAAIMDCRRNLRLEYSNISPTIWNRMLVSQLILLGGEERKRAAGRRLRGDEPAVALKEGRVPRGLELLQYQNAMRAGVTRFTRAWVCMIPREYSWAVQGHSIVCKGAGTRVRCMGLVLLQSWSHYALVCHEWGTRIQGS